MKTQLNFSVLLLISILFLSSCDKDELPVYGEKTYVGDIINPTAEEFQKILSFGYDTIIGSVMFNDSYEANISDFRALSNIRLISGTLRIQSANRFNSFYGLGKLESIGSMLINHSRLTSFDGLDSLKYIKEYLRIENNGVLLNINGLSNLDSVGEGLTIWSNYYLENIDGLINLKNIGGKLTIGGFSLVNLDSLINLESVGEYLNIFGVYNMVDIKGLSKLKTIGGYLSIGAAEKLYNLEGLDALQYIGGNLMLAVNRIKDLDALENIQFIGGKIQIIKNYRLTDLCGLRPYLSTGNFNNIYDIYDNLYNPTMQEIIDGDCN
jgi:hypothetical protein